LQDTAPCSLEIEITVDALRPMVSHPQTRYFFLASLDVGSGCRYGHYKHNTHFSRCLHNQDGDTSYMTLKTEN